MFNSFCAHARRFVFSEMWETCETIPHVEPFHKKWNYSAGKRLIFRRNNSTNGTIPQKWNSSAINFFVKEGAKVEKVGHLQNKFSTRICAQGP